MEEDVSENYFIEDLMKEVAKLEKMSNDNPVLFFSGLLDRHKASFQELVDLKAPKQILDLQRKIILNTEQRLIKAMMKDASKNQCPNIEG